MKCFSKITFFAALCVLCTSFLNLDAMHPEERMLRKLHQNIYQKRYVKHKDVLVTKDGIFVLEKGQKTPVRHLYTDSQGRIYYKTSAVEKGVHHVKMDAVASLEETVQSVDGLIKRRKKNSITKK